MPNLDKIHYKFFPKSQTASTGTRLITFAWIIEITVALVGLSIAALFFTSGGETGLRLEEVTSKVGVDAYIVGLAFVVVAIMELTKIPLATALYYSVKTSFKIIFALALLAVNFSTFETIIQGFELAYNQRSQIVDIERNKLKEIQEQIRALDKNQDTSDIDEKISVINNQIEQYRNERVKINISKENEISQIQKQYTGDNANIKNLTNQRNYLNEEINSLKSTLSELDKELAKTKDGFFVKQSDKIKVRITDYQLQLKDKENKRDDLNKQIRDLTEKASGAINPRVEAISKNKDLELERNQQLIDRANEQKANLEKAKAAKLQDQSEVETKKEALRDLEIKQEEKFLQKARQNQIYRIAVKIKIARAWLNDVDLGDQVIDEAELTQQDTDTAFWLWFGGLAFVISIIGTLVAFAGLHLKDERMHILRNEPKNRFRNMLRAFTKVPVDASKYIRAATKRLIAPKIVKEKVEIEKVVEKIVEKPVIEEKIVYQKVEVPKEVIKKVYVHVPFPTDDQEIIKRGPIVHNDDDDKKKK